MQPEFDTEKQYCENQWLICEVQRLEVAAAKPNLPKEVNLGAQQNQGRVKRSFVALVGNIRLYTVARDAKQCEMSQMSSTQGET